MNKKFSLYFDPYWGVLYFQLDGRLEYFDVVTQKWLPSPWGSARRYNATILEDEQDFKLQLIGRYGV